MRHVRGREIGMIFQEPMTSLNPVLTVGRQLTEPPEIHLSMTPAQSRARAIELLGMVGISDAERRLRQYPHQFSGGMRQRMMIAMSMACNPALIIADEPTTALDVTIQAQILELMKGLSRKLGVAMVMITHNLGVVARYADRVNVMYAGRIVERGTAAEIYANPRHPYTLGLLRSVPRLDEPRRAKLLPIQGQPPDLTRLPPGCAFQPRCQYAIDRCLREAPPLETVSPGHVSACWVSAELKQKVTA
jgi:oligopeptide/dipeptide ABC transporter ATP-binding protein